MNIDYIPLAEIREKFGDSKAKRLSKIARNRVETSWESIMS
jgi:hypothetical protein